MKTLIFPLVTLMVLLFVVPMIQPSNAVAGDKNLHIQLLTSDTIKASDVDTIKNIFLDKYDSFGLYFITTEDFQADLKIEYGIQGSTTHATYTDSVILAAAGFKAITLRSALVERIPFGSDWFQCVITKRVSINGGKYSVGIQAYPSLAK